MQASGGELQVFLDADTDPGQQCLERLLASLEQQGGLVSFQLDHRIQKPYEQLSGLFNMFCLLLQRNNQLRLQHLVIRVALQDA